MGWDHAFQQSTSREHSINPDIAKFLVSPSFTRIYYGHLLDIINTTYNSSYMTSWVSRSIWVSSDKIGRRSLTTSRLAARVSSSQLNSLAPQVAFAISTNSGNDFSVTTPTITMSGSGWINVDEIRLNGSSQSLPITWTSQNQWQVTVPLFVVGQNPITLTAYDTHGIGVGSDSITVTTNTAVAQPKNSLRFPKLMYHPSPDGNEQYEFIELTNIDATTRSTLLA